MSGADPLYYNPQRSLAPPAPAVACDGLIPAPKLVTGGAGEVPTYHPITAFLSHPNPQPPTFFSFPNKKAQQQNHIPVHTQHTHTYILPHAHYGNLEIHGWLGQHAYTPAHDSRISRT